MKKEKKVLTVDRKSLCMGGIDLHSSSRRIGKKKRRKKTTMYVQYNKQVTSCKLYNLNIFCR